MPPHHHLAPKPQTYPPTPTSTHCYCTPTHPHRPHGDGLLLVLAHLDAAPVTVRVLGHLRGQEVINGSGEVQVGADVAAGGDHGPLHVIHIPGCVCVGGVPSRESVSGPDEVCMSGQRKGRGGGTAVNESSRPSNSAAGTCMHYPAPPSPSYLLNLQPRPGPCPLTLGCSAAP
jgi:hypothetical protein